MLVKAPEDSYVYVDFSNKAAIAKIFYAKDTSGDPLGAENSKNTYREKGSAYTSYQPYANGVAVDKKDGKGVGVRLVVDDSGTLVKVKDAEVMSQNQDAVAYLTTNKYGVVTSDTTNGDEE